MVVLYRCQLLSYATAILFSSQAAFAEPISPSTTDDFRDDGLVIRYDVTDGAVSVFAPTGTLLTGLELTSKSRVFTESCRDLDGLLDVCSDAQVFKVDINGFNSFDFGLILPPSLAGPDIAGDLLVNGASGGELNVGAGIFVQVVPEPDAIALCVIGTFAIGGVRRRKW